MAWKQKRRGNHQWRVWCEESGVCIIYLSIQWYRFHLHIWTHSHQHTHTRVHTCVHTHARTRTHTHTHVHSQPCSWDYTNTEVKWNSSPWTETPFWYKGTGQKEQLQHIAFQHKSVQWHWVTARLCSSSHSQIQRNLDISLYTNLAADATHLYSVIFFCGPACPIL